MTITTIFIFILIPILMILGCIDWDGRSPRKSRSPKKVDTRVRRSNGQISRKVPINDHTGTIGYIYL